VSLKRRGNPNGLDSSNLHFVTPAATLMLSNPHSLGNDHIASHPELLAHVGMSKYAKCRSGSPAADR
jgi:hypothetical protein